uniref:Uncharacterized protein n=1 Tax=Arion vulgaris TaxID=1028688 RepID=A0A0B7BTV1_9EUPU
MSTNFHNPQHYIKGPRRSSCSAVETFLCKNQIGAHMIGYSPKGIICSYQLKQSDTSCYRAHALLLRACYVRMISQYTWSVSY